MVAERQALAGALGVIASVVLHALAAVVLWQLPAGAETPDGLLEVRLWEGTAAGPGSAPHRAPRSVVPAGGHRSVQNVDAPSPGGRGDRAGATDVILLVERAHPILLQDSPMTALGRAQAQRIRTAPDRATAEPRRATPHPMHTPFLASGQPGGHPERRPPARVDPRPGAHQAPRAARLGGAEPRPEQRPLTAAEAAHRLGTPRSPARALGRPEPSPGRGILRGQGEREGRTARVAMGRPPVDRGRAATPSRRREWRVRDNRDAELLAHRPTQSWEQSSERSGPEAGEGRGGAGGGGPPGVGGGSREGGRALPHGPGHGSHPALDTGSHRYQRWFLELQRRVAEAVEFPRERLVQMDQGTTVYRVVIDRDGSLTSRPELLRSSRFADLDAAALEAIERSAPFAPLPDDLMGSRQHLAVVVPIRFANPMIR